MVNGKSTGRTIPERKHRSMAFVYAFDKLNKSVQLCDNNALEWIMTSIRGMKRLYVMEKLQMINIWNSNKKSGLVADFMYNCN